MMGALKAPGPDGLHAHFFQSQWSRIGTKVCQLIRDIWKEPHRLGKINHTHIILIPKVDNPTSLKEFRPISLCNVSFKIITKIITSRLKNIMPYIIRPQQCSFIQGRQGSDNTIIAQEAIHTMRQCRRTKSYVAIKVDMEKAYDRLDWGFLQDTLLKLGIQDHLIKLIMACTSLTEMKVLWNGEESAPFHPSRGVRQGDPLSPYLFILCMERLGHRILQEVQRGKWKGLRFNKQSPTISHLFFADDLILFGEASGEQIQVMRDIMVNFCKVSAWLSQKLSSPKMFISIELENSATALELVLQET